MIETIQKEIPASSVPAYRVTCDVCGLKSVEIPHTTATPEWIDANGDLINISVLKSRFSRGSVVEKIAFDICPGCFESVIIPAIKSVGAADRIVIAAPEDPEEEAVQELSVRK